MGPVSIGVEVQRNADGDTPSRLGHVERSTGWIAEVSKLNVVAQKRRSRPTKICDEVLMDDRMKLGMDCAVRCLRTMVPSFSIQG